MQESSLTKLLDQLLALPKESEWLEFKHNNSDPREIGEYVSALSNSAVIHRQEAAYLIWGIADDTKEVVGTTFNPDTARQGGQALEMWLSQKLRPAPHFQFAVGTYCDKSVVVMAIRPLKEEPVKFDRVAYIRVGSHKTKLDDQPGKLKEFWTQAIAGNSGGWDQRKEDRATLDDLDSHAIEEFFERLERAGRRDIPKGLSTESALEKLQLLVEGKPTRAALLLLGKEPKRFYPTAYIKAGRFKSATSILDDREFTGTLFQQLDSAIGWLQERMTRRLMFDGSKESSAKKISHSPMERGEEWSYPLLALREAIANAVCHRDYSSNLVVSIRLFDDRLEIWNPGTLPSDLSPAVLLSDHPSHPPNMLIAECFYNTRIIERWGTGTVRMAEALAGQHQPPPAFDVTTQNVFKAILFASGYSDAELVEMGLNERQVSVVRYMQVNKTITSAQYQELTGASKPTASRDLSELVAKQIVAKLGTTGKGTSYHLLERKGLTKGSA